MPHSLGQSSTGEAVELTQVDLFGLLDWQHKRVAVDGFTLGITLEQAFEIAKARNLRIISSMPPRTVGDVGGSCRGGSCSVYEVDGPFIGVGFFFETRHLTKITVSYSVDMDPEGQRANIRQDFKGLTRRFFTDYSENLRNKVLGPAEGVSDTTRPKDSGSFRYIEYDYRDSGVLVHVIVTKDPTPDTLDLAVDFVAPK